VVGVCLPKGPDQIAAVLGVLAAGGVYVPVGVDQPGMRRATILAAAGTVTVLDEDTFGGAANAEALPAPVEIPDSSLAYVIFTSGSTGVPKGVEISHRSAVNTVEDINDRYGVSDGDTVLAVSALDFDLSVYDIFGLLAVGGSVVCIAEDQRRDAYAWADLVRSHGVTVWNTVPALLDMLLTAATVEDLTGLRLAMVSGDWVGLDLYPRLVERKPGCRLIALGGATEAAIWSNAFEVTGVPAHWRSVPYGFPLRNQVYRVVDGAGRDCPDWVPGELWIGGVGVAQGYRGDSARTAERFITHVGRRWYRTGDQGRYWPDGTLEFLGRTDHQVKIRGHRIELGEIEAVLAAHPAVTAAVVTVSAGHLTAAVATDGDPDDLTAFLTRRLPGYMIPDRTVVLDAMPLSANGKVDRAAIAGLLADAAPATDDEPPQGALETELARIWADLLGVATVGRRQSFFGLGGDSLAATRLVEEIRRRFATRIPLRQLYAAPTVAALATHLDAHTPAELVDLEDGTI
jgi:amino acid adenylation domain-containing protein